MLEEGLGIGDTLAHWLVHLDRRHVIYRTLTVAYRATRLGATACRKDTYHRSERENWYARYSEMGRWRYDARGVRVGAQCRHGWPP